MKNKCQFKVGDRVVVVRDGNEDRSGYKDNNTNSKVGDVLTVVSIRNSPSTLSGFWLETKENGNLFICPSLCKPFTIEVGKRYVRRDGKISGVMQKTEHLTRVRDSDSEYYFECNGHGKVYSWTESPEDLMKEYTEPNIEQMKKTVEVSEDFVKQAYESACPTWKEKIEKEFPSLFNEKELTKGKWYRNALDGIFLFDGTFSINYGDKRPNGHGTNCNDWFDGDDGIGWSMIGIKEATNKEVIYALRKEAERRFGNDWKNAKIKKCLFHKDNALTNNGCFMVSESTEQLWNRNGNIFNNGKWAEPIKEEPIKEVTLEEVAKLIGVSVDKLRIKD
jgi:hypothetical protein